MRRLKVTPKNIDVFVHTDGSIEVRDDGRGVPVDTEPSTGLSGVELVYTRLHAGGKFGGGLYGLLPVVCTGWVPQWLTPCLPAWMCR